VDKEFDFCMSGPNKLIKKQKTLGEYTPVKDILQKSCIIFSPLEINFEDHSNKKL